MLTLRSLHWSQLGATVCFETARAWSPVSLRTMLVTQLRGDTVRLGPVPWASAGVGGDPKVCCGVLRCCLRPGPCPRTRSTRSRLKRDAGRDVRPDQACLVEWVWWSSAETDRAGEEGWSAVTRRTEMWARESHAQTTNDEWVCRGFTANT